MLQRRVRGVSGTGAISPPQNIDSDSATYPLHTTIGALTLRREVYKSRSVGAASHYSNTSRWVDIGLWKCTLVIQIRVSS